MNIQETPLTRPSGRMFQAPPRASHQTASSINYSIYRTDEIYRRKRKPENKLHQMAGEQASTAMISRLQKAESMEGGSPEEIWKGTG